MTMQFGMPTLIEIKSPEGCAALCRELGLTFIELNMNLPEYQADKMDVIKLRKIADEYDVYLTIHLDENLNPCDFNEKVAGAYTDTVLQTIENAKRLKAHILNMHLNPGVWFTLPNKKVFLFEEYETEYLHKLAAFRDTCTAAIGDTDMKICVENTETFQHGFGADSLAVLLESPVFAVTFDIGHDAGNDFKQRPAIDRHKNRLHHMHIHDARGKDNHLPLGDGNLELGEYLELAKAHDCRSVLEVKTADGLRQSVNWLKGRGWL